jgi:hypothetical protein
LVDISPPLVAHLEPTEAVEPRKRALHHPPKPSQPLARFDAAPCNPRDDAARPQCAPTSGVVIALVSVQLRGALARPSPLPLWQAQRWDRIDRLLQHGRIMPVGPRDRHRKRQALTIDDEMALGSQLAAIRWVLASHFAPPELAHLRCRVMPVPSRSAQQPATAVRAHDGGQSRLRLAASRAGAASRSCHCRSPSPGATSRRRMPLFKTKRMPVSAARSAMRGRPPLSLGRSGGRSGAMIAQSLSLTSGLLIPPVYHSADYGLQHLSP